MVRAGAPSRHPLPRSTAGFTLLETLVVMVILTLTLGLLLQLFTHVLQFKSSFLSRIETQRVQALGSQWFRQVVANVHTVPPNAEARFRGKSNQLSGSTFAGLDANAGVPTAFVLELVENDDGTDLIYREEGRLDWVIAKWPGSRTTFRFLDESGHWQDRWPPLQPIEDVQLPVAVMLAQLQNDGQSLWLTRVRSDRVYREQEQ